MREAAEQVISFFSFLTVLNNFSSIHHWPDFHLSTISSWPTLTFSIFFHHTSFYYFIPHLFSVLPPIFLCFVFFDPHLNLSFIPLIYPIAPSVLAQDSQSLPQILNGCWQCYWLIVWQPISLQASSYSLLREALEGNLKIILVGVQSVSHSEYRTTFPCGCLKSTIQMHRMKTAQKFSYIQ